MNYEQYKKAFPGDILVYIEEFRQSSGQVIVDFIDSNEYSIFRRAILETNEDSSINKPTMVWLENYKGKAIRENKVYAIKSITLETWQQQGSIITVDNSYLIGYKLDASATKDVFVNSISVNNIFLWNFFYSKSNQVVNALSLNKSRISVIVRNVGQGSWNEILSNNTVNVVFDAGAPTNGSKLDVLRIIANRNDIYSVARPMLILSHWDKDHYHALLGMTDSQLQSNFSGFICRSELPNLTSRILFNRIRTAVSHENTYPISAERFPDIGLRYFKILNPLEDQVIIYNSIANKNRNKSGIVILVRNSTGSVILSGDTDYKYISADILPKLNYRHNHNLVVPHHGGKAGKYEYNMPKLVKPKKAIISVGLNHFKHPDENHMEYLTNDGFVVIRTDYKNTDIIVDI